MDRSGETAIRRWQPGGGMVGRFSRDDALERFSAETDASGGRDVVGSPGSRGTDQGRKKKDLSWRTQDSRRNLGERLSTRRSQKKDSHEGHEGQRRSQRFLKALR